MALGPDIDYSTPATPVPGSADDPLGIYPLRVVKKEKKETSSLGDLKKEAARRKPVAAAPAKKIVLPKGYKLDSATAAGPQTAPEKRFTETSPAPDEPQSAKEVAQAAPPAAVPVPSSSSRIEDIRLPKQYMTPPTPLKRAAQPAPAAAPPAESPKRATQPARAASAPAPASADPLMAQTQRGIQSDKDTIKGILRSVGLPSTKEEFEQAMEQDAQHPIRSLVEAYPPLAAAIGLAKGAKRMAGEYAEAGKALATEGQSVPARVGAAAAHIGSAVPFVGPARDAVLDAATRAGVGLSASPEEYAKNLKIAAASPEVRGALVGTGIQAALNAYGAMSDAYAQRRFAKPEYLPPEPPAAEPPFARATTIRAPGLPAAAEQAPIEGQLALPAPTEGLTPAEQELEQTIDSHVSQHPKAEAEVRRDLEQIAPEDRQAVLDAINQEGVEAYQRGDTNAAVEAVQKAHILRGIMEAEARAARAARIAARPAEVPPEPPPTPAPPVRSSDPRLAPAPTPEPTTRPVATAEPEPAPEQGTLFGAPEAPAPIVPRETPTPEAAEASPKRPAIEEMSRQELMDELGIKKGSGDPRLRWQTKRLAAALAPARALVDYFTPGNVIFGDYWKKYDKVLDFKPKGRSGDGHFEVQVIESDKDGNPAPGARPRWHSTFPDTQKDKIVVRAPAPPPVAATTAAAPAPEEAAPAPKAEQPEPGLVGKVANKIGKRKAKAVTAPPEAPAAPAAEQPEPVAEGSAFEEHRDLLNQLDELRRTKPRPLAKLFGERGPTPEQEAKWKQDMREWNRKANAIRRRLPALLEKANREFRESQAGQEPEAAPAAPPEAPVAAPTTPEASTPAAAQEAPVAAPAAGPVTTERIAGSSPPEWLVPGTDYTIRLLNDKFDIYKDGEHVDVGAGADLNEAKAKIQAHMATTAPAAEPQIGDVAKANRERRQAAAKAPVGPDEAAVRDALTTAGMYDAATARVFNRAVKKNVITSPDRLDELVRIASAIKSLDPKTTNVAAAIEAEQYRWMATLELMAASRPEQGVFPAEAIDRAKQVWDSVMHEESPVQAARVTGGKIKIGADPKALAEVLGSSLYGKDPASVVTKELAQNAWDAIRLVKGEGPKDVTIRFDEFGNTITVSDTGPGMTRKELETVFTDLGRTGKLTQADASGGFGIAKAAPFMMPTRLRLRTVNREKGKLYEHTFTSTPDEINTKGVDLETRELPEGSDEKTGTEIDATFDKDHSQWNAQRFALNSQRSLHPPGNLKIEGVYGSQKPIPAVSPKPITTIDAPGAKLSLYTSPETEASQGYATVEINNNGIYQFTTDVFPPVQGMAIPKRIAIDVQSTVRERHPDYPFQANREGFRNSSLSDAINKLLNEHIFEASAKNHNQMVADAIRNLPVVKVGATEIPIFDSGKRLTPDELKRLQSDPAFIDLAHTIHQVTRNAITKLASADLPISLTGLGSKIKRIGIVLSDDVHGVHITDPTDESSTFLFVNPFSDKLRETPERAASRVWHTIKHEIIHDKVKGHHETFTSAEATVAGALGSRSELAGIQELEDVYADPANPRAVRPDLGEALQLYEDSRGRAETSPDIFRGERLHTGEHAGAEGRRGDERGVRPSGEGTLSGLVQPARIEPLAKLKAEAAARKPIHEPDLPESARRPIKTFVSPSTTDLENLEQAQTELSSPAHKLMHQESSWFLNELDSKVKPRNVIGIWKDGAENTLMHEFPKDTDHDFVTYHSAILARAGWQKFMLNFFPHEEGNDILYRLKLPKESGTAAEIAKVLAQHGIEASTILEERDGHAVLVATTGENEQDTMFAVQHAVKQLGGKDGTGAELVRTRGRSEYVGEDDRDRAEELFTRIIDDKENLHPRWREARLRLESRPGFNELRRLVRQASKPVSQSKEPLRKLEEDALALEPDIDPNDVIVNAKNNLNWDDIKDYLLPVEREAYEKKPELQRKIVAAVNMMPNVDEWDAAVKAGSVGRLWYERSARAFDALIASMPEAFKPKDKAKFLNFVSALSPVQTVRLNLMMAIDLWDKWNKAGRPTDVQWEDEKKFTGVANKSAKLYRLMAGLEKEEVPPEERGLFSRGSRAAKKRAVRGVDLESRLYNSIRALQGQPLSGPKVSAFAPNLGENVEKSTNDTWMAVFADTDPNTINQKHLYDGVSAHVRIAAKKSGIPPRQAQAAIWSFIKSLAELSGWGANRWIPPQQIIDQNLLTPDSIAAQSQDFADLMLRDYGIRAKLSKIGADLNVLDRKLNRIVPPRPAVEQGTTADSIKRLSGAASRLEAVRGSERISRHLARKVESSQGGFFPPPEEEESPIRRAIRLSAPSQLQALKIEAKKRNPKR